MSLWILDTDTSMLLSHHHPGVTAQALMHPPELVTVMSRAATFVTCD